MIQLNCKRKKNKKKGNKGNKGKKSYRWKNNKSYNNKKRNRSKNREIKNWKNKSKSIDIHILGKNKRNVKKKKSNVWRSKRKRKQKRREKNKKNEWGKNWIIEDRRNWLDSNRNRRKNKTVSNKMTTSKDSKVKDLTWVWTAMLWKNTTIMKILNQLNDYNFII